MSDSEDLTDKKPGKGQDGRSDYDRKYKGVRRHMDWYFRKVLAIETDAGWSQDQIVEAMRRETGIAIPWDGIRRYNTEQFARHEVAPLTRMSEARYTLNEQYYMLVADRVYEPGTGKPGRPRRTVHSTDDDPLSERPAGIL
jgi:hypothetical protein